jgi:hypothetical protein
MGFPQGHSASVKSGSNGRKACSGLVHGVRRSRTRANRNAPPPSHDSGLEPVLEGVVPGMPAPGVGLAAPRWTR